MKCDMQNNSTGDLHGSLVVFLLALGLILTCVHRHLITVRLNLMIRHKYYTI